MTRASKQLQRDILAKFEKIKPQPPPRKDSPKEKTNLMKLIEEQYQMPIEQIIWNESIIELSHNLGVSEYTVTRWRRMFPIEYQRGRNNRKLPVSKSGGN